MMKSTDIELKIEKYTYVINGESLQSVDDAFCTCEHPVPQATLSHVCQNFGCWKILRQYKTLIK